MPEIGSLIDPTVVERMQEIALLDPSEPAKPVTKAKVEVKPDPGYRVIKAATEPNPPRRLTMADAIEIDPESEAMIDALCVDCDVPLLIDPKVPEGVDPTAPRVPICKKDAEIRAAFAAVNEQRRIEIIRRREQHERTRVVSATEYQKENPVIDLKETPDAELGAVVKKTMKTKKAVKIKAARKQAKAEQVVAEVKDKKARKKNRKAQNYVLPGFVVDGSLSVEPLDVSALNLDESPSAIERSPYNAARFRLEGSRSLFPPVKDDEEVPEGYVPTTYRTLVNEHVRLSALAAAKASARPAKVKAAKTRKVVAVVDTEEQAKKIAAFAGISVKKARKILAGR